MRNLERYNFRAYIRNDNVKERREAIGHHGGDYLREASDNIFKDFIYF